MVSKEETNSYEENYQYETFKECFEALSEGKTLQVKQLDGSFYYYKLKFFSKGVRLLINKGHGWTKKGAYIPNKGNGSY